MAFCLGNLAEILHQILHPDQYHLTWVLDNEKIPHLQSLFQKVSFLRDFLANSTPAIQARIEHLEDLIRDTAEKAEDLLEAYIKAQVLSSPDGESILVSPPDLGDVIQIFEITTAEMIKIMDGDEQSENMPPIVPSRSDHMITANDVLVGVQTALVQLKDRLTSTAKAVEVIPIVGMGGIGKTTLACKLYDEYSLNKHFDIRLWATVTQNYDQRQVLLNLLNCTESEKKIHELKVDLHKKLFNRRYLIVMDDVWSSKVWDDIRTSFPNDNTRSRVILTTRENDVADYVSSKKHEMVLLNKEESWELFQTIVFGVERCSTDLKEVAQKIVSSCDGLPLAIKVIGGFLSRAERSKDLWERVAHDVSSFVGEESEQFLGIFSLSYSNLPHYLKPCLLYISAYPEDYAIPASRLIKLWVAEGFLNPIKGKSPEEVARMCLKALVDRNLIFVRQTTFSRRVKSYGIHDLLRDLCMRKAKEKRFISEACNMSKDPLCFRRICDSASERRADLSGSMELTPQVHSYQIVGQAEGSFFLNNHCFGLSLLRVLDVFNLLFESFPEDIPQLVGLRYLAISCEFSLLPESIIMLRNLQTIIIRFSLASSTYSFPGRIFELPQLRHIELIRYDSWGILVDVPSISILENLQTLSGVSVRVLNSLLGKIPNLKKLGINIVDRLSAVEDELDLTCFKKWETFFAGVMCADEEIAAEDEIDLTCFQKLETLRVVFFGQTNFILPDSLKNLTIFEAFPLSSTHMSRYGALANLELLRLAHCEFENATWEPSEGEFCNLQYLQLDDCRNLENWIADETHFPQLVHLRVYLCPHLKEIPLEIGRIETLEIIEVDYCKNCVFESARSILQDQRYQGNDLLQIRLGEQLGD